MKSLSKKLLVSVVIIAFLVSASCTRNVKEEKILNENAKYNLIIAGDSSEYKDSIRENLIDQYKTRCNIDVINIEGLKNVSEDEYDAMLIMDTCMAWGAFNPSVKSFMEKTEKKENIVLFMTADDPEWDYSYQHVDAITSASNMENKDAITTELSERIGSIISGL